MRWTEINTPVVYHSTFWGPEIIKDDMIKANPIKMAAHITHGRDQEGELGVCVTRSLWFAKAYAPIIFVLDRQAITNSYKIIKRAEGAYDPSHYADYRMEAEEFIVCNGLSLKRYLRAIWMSTEERTNEENTPVAEHPLFKGYFRPV